MDEVDRARQEVIDALAEATGLYGIDAAIGRVYGHLYFADDPLTPADIDADSELTAGEVADALATLERWHLARPAGEMSDVGAGDGTADQYVAQRDFGEAYEQLLRAEGEREVEIVGQALANAEARLEDAEGSEAVRDLERVRDLEELHGSMDALVDVLERVPLSTVMDLLEQYVNGELPEADVDGTRE